MLGVVYLLFGALFTAATAIALGRLLLRRAAVDLYREEENLLGFIVGCAALSLIVFLLATIGLARKGVFLAVGIVAIGAALRSGAYRSTSPSFAPLPRAWKWLLVVAFAAFTVVYLVAAMEPEFSPDGVSYHLNFVNQYNRAHGFVRVSNLYANLSQGIELLFLFAFAFGRHSSAAVVHFAFLVVLALSVLSYARRAGYPLAGICAALLVYACPVIGRDGTCAYIDVAVTGVLFGGFYLLAIWDEQRKTGLLVLIGLVAGFAYAAKYTAFLAVPYAVGFVLWRQRSWKAASTVALSALILIAPWTTKNILWAGNPFSPMLNRVFPNPTVHPSFESEWAAYLATYDLRSRSDIPMEVTIRGERLGGFLGPVFLLLPLALLSLRLRTGRRLLFAGTVFFLPYYFNVGTRFVIPALPFVALALTLALARVPVLLAALAVFHCLASWPWLVTVYCDPYAWRLKDISWQAALRVIPEDAWLSRDITYLTDRRIDTHTPDGARIFSLSGHAEAYSKRTFLSSFLSAESEVLRDIFYCAALPDFEPTYMRVFQFGPRSLRKVRLVEMARASRNTSWSLSEIRLFRDGQELRRTPAWSLTARPNPWDIEMAFDTRAVTRWRSWQAFAPGMFVEIDLGTQQPVDAVRVEGSPDQAGTQIRIDGADESGRWETISTQTMATTSPAIGFLGKSAMSEIRARGVQYFFLRVQDLGASAVLRDPAAWGLTQVDEFFDGRLYQIDAPLNAAAR